MKLSCAGISHQTAPVEVRERYSIAPSQTSEALRRMLAHPGVKEAVLLSTCNRVELYMAGGSTAMEVLATVHVAAGNGSHEHARGAFYEAHGADAATHLFRVACGLESMVLGETEILGQVKQAYASAVEAGAAGPVLNRLFQRAFRAAKHARSHTAITRGAVSVGSVAVDLAERIFGELRNCHIMILGAGETSERTARALLSRGARSMIVSNRSAERAAKLAAELGGQAISFDDWGGRLAEVDIVISSTAAPHAIVTKDVLAAPMRRRLDRPLFLIDLAVPRDIEPEVNRIEGVYLYDIDSLQSIAAETLELRKAELGVCVEILDGHVADFIRWMGSHPAVGAANGARARQPFL